MDWRCGTTRTTEKILNRIKELMGGIMGDVNVSGYRAMGWKLSFDPDIADRISNAASQSYRNHESII